MVFTIHVLNPAAHVVSYWQADKHRQWASFSHRLSLDKLSIFQIGQCFQQLGCKVSRCFDAIVRRDQNDHGNGRFFILLIRQVLIKCDRNLEPLNEHGLDQLASRTFIESS